MSGIRTGPRLENLERVHRQTLHEIANARRLEHWREIPALEDLRDRLAAEIAKERPTEPPERPKPPRAPSGPSAEVLLLEQLGVTARQVKEWAVEQGLLAAVVRGRVKLELVEAYAETQPEPEPAVAGA